MDEIKVTQESVNDIGTKKTGNRPFLIIGAAIVFVVIAIGLFLSRSKNVEQIAGSQNTNPDQITASGPVKEFTVEGSNFKFDPDKIVVNKGDTVKIIFKDSDGMHNLVVDGYGVSTKTIRGGVEETIQFVADKTGSFEYYCSIANHKEAGMTGILTVN